MSDNNINDIPATIKLQQEILILQEEYKTALIKKKHPDKNLIYSFELSGNYFEDKCQIIYESKLRRVCLNIIDEHKKSKQSFINLLEYPIFKDLVFNALFETIDSN